jgi:hypothetical protein
VELKLLIPLKGVFTTHLVEHFYGFCIIFLQFCKKVDYYSRYKVPPPQPPGSIVAQVKDPFIKQSYYLTVYQGREAFFGMGLGEVSAV